MAYHFNSIQNEKRILIVDAGGGTVDISSYETQEDQEGSFYELAAPECHRIFSSIPSFAEYLYLGKIRGSIFVTKRAQMYLEGRGLSGPCWYQILPSSFLKATFSTLHSNKMSKPLRSSLTSL